jgi:hypothetical protein
MPVFMISWLVQWAVSDAKVKEAMVEPVIVSDPDIMSGTRAFGALAFPSRILLTIWRVAIRWVNSCDSSPLLRVKWQSRRWRKQRNRCSPESDEDSVGRVPTTGFPAPLSWP